MKPEKTDTSQSELFKNRLSNQLNPRDPLFILAHQINWSFFEEEFGALYPDGPGQPPKPVRLMVGLMMLQHMNGLSDEQVVYQWVQIPIGSTFVAMITYNGSFPAIPPL